jgi:protein-tyrosine phosphatase
MSTWDAGAAGILSLPSGRLIRGRGLRRPLPAGPEPEFAVYLLGSSPPPVPWEQRWLRWPDFWLPANERHALAALQEAWRRSEHQRVEIACWGGRGRTGTALAIIAVLDGVPPARAVTYVREHYSKQAVETPWQSWYVGRVARRMN